MCKSNQEYNQIHESNCANLIRNTLKYLNLIVQSNQEYNQIPESDCANLIWNTTKYMNQIVQI